MVGPVISRGVMFVTGLALACIVLACALFAFIIGVRFNGPTEPTD